MAAPKAMEMANSGDWIKESGTRPFPEKFLTKRPAKKIAAMEPAKVVTVAHVIAPL